MPSKIVRELGTAGAHYVEELLLLKLVAKLTKRRLPYGRGFICSHDVKRRFFLVEQIVNLLTLNSCKKG